MITLDHIGIAVEDAAGREKAKRLFELLGLQVGATEAVPEQGVLTQFLALPESASNLELLEPTDPEGTVAKFVQKKGPGIHHLSFRVANGELDGLCQKLRTEGYRLIYDAPKAGAHHMRINFIHPASAGGVLIELMEPQAWRCSSSITPWTSGATGFSCPGSRLRRASSFKTTGFGRFSRTRSFMPRSCISF
jgi:methylmalonyl-CoA epimerase